MGGSGNPIAIPDDSDTSSDWWELGTENGSNDSSNDSPGPGSDSGVAIDELDHVVDMEDEAVRSPAMIAIRAVKAGCLWVAR